MIDLPPLDLRSVIVGALIVIFGKCLWSLGRDYWREWRANRNRREIDERIAALDARLIDYDAVATGAIADLEASWHEKQEETK